MKSTNDSMIDGSQEAHNDSATSIVCMGCAVPETHGSLNFTTDDHPSIHYVIAKNGRFHQGADDETVRGIQLLRNVIDHLHQVIWVLRHPHSSIILDVSRQWGRVVPLAHESALLPTIGWHGTGSPSTLKHGKALARIVESTVVAACSMPASEHQTISAAAVCGIQVVIPDLPGARWTGTRPTAARSRRRRRPNPRTASTASDRLKSLDQ
ncbi:hypothetical protein GCM10023349_24140 [Nocardioides conyzicola]|uniref:Uncharacterized protein n=1 Tax=Nocardioides conyzicola TaxID=1651781 RepID=A0ABP8XCN4_9ACTN